jgi:hypothetical protein
MVHRATRLSFVTWETELLWGQCRPLSDANADPLVKTNHLFRKHATIICWNQRFWTLSIVRYSNIQKKLTETGSVFAFRWEERDTYFIGSLSKSWYQLLNYWFKTTVFLYRIIYNTSWLPSVSRVFIFPNLLSDKYTYIHFYIHRLYI